MKSEEAIQSPTRSLGTFLRSHRERVLPAELGLAHAGRRRTPGLRREEVAQLCGVSTTWYTWLEQGRPIRASPSVLRHIAQALQLSRAERLYLFEIKPGAHWWVLHNLAVQMLHDEGNFDQYYKYGIGHFIGMEVHDEGDYEQPLQPGMAMAIEHGIILPGGLHVQFEDNVIVTETGHDWLSQSIPIEPGDVEKMLQTPSSFAGFAGKPWPPSPAPAK